jgi:hypothetical protein
MQFPWIQANAMKINALGAHDVDLHANDIFQKAVAVALNCVSSRKIPIG